MGATRRGDGGADATVSDGNPFGDGSSDHVAHHPTAESVVDVTIADGVVTTTPVTFTALGNGTIGVPASFTLDRGELGALVASTGVFTASGNVSGTGTVTRDTADAEGDDHRHRQITMSQNGKPTYGDAGATRAATTSAATTASGATTTASLVDHHDAHAPRRPRASARQRGRSSASSTRTTRRCGPRGVLAPLLQWQTTHAAQLRAVKVHLAQKSFTFDGYYDGARLW